MRILIVGSDENAYLIAGYVVKKSGEDVVFITSDYGINIDGIREIGISENDNKELLDFAIANEITLTVVTSYKAIANDISGYFMQFGQPIFAPGSASAGIGLFRSNAKKMMFKLKIPTMKYGIFDRENQAIEYASEVRRPLVIKDDINILSEEPYYTYSFREAKEAIERNMYNSKIIIEDLTEAKEVFCYYITDGYTALPAGSITVTDREHLMTEICSPDKYISEEIETDIIRETIYPILDELAERSVPYSGILGVDLLINNDTYNVIEFLPFYKPNHLHAILPLMKTDITDLFLSVACGSMSDEYNHIEFYNLSSYLKVIPKADERLIKKIDDDNLICSFAGGKCILTEKSATVGKARERLNENIEFIQSSGVEIE